MKPVFAPEYYTSFACIASACRHSCCVGWEIDLDDGALDRYAAVEGELGDRLARGIDRRAEPPCFVLTPDERCPFLRRDGLCDIITHLGEDALCHICADHPRFRHVQADRVEVGLGLCCEAAASLILGRQEPFRLVELPAAVASRDRFSMDAVEEADGDTLALRARREALLAIATDRTRPLSARTEHLLAADSGTLPAYSFAEWAQILRDMERLDPAWDGSIDALAAKNTSPAHELAGESHTAYEQLLTYFLYRYAADEDAVTEALAAPVRFAVLSTVLIHAITDATGQELCEVARLYSSEVEYSEENLARMMTLLA